MALERNNADAQFLKGRVLIQMNRPDEAAEPFLRAAGIDPSKAIHFTAVGLAYNQLGQYDIAIAAFTRSLAIQPDNPNVLNQLGIAYVGVSEDLLAFQAFKKSIIQSIINQDKKNAARALGLVKSMNLVDQISSEELQAIEDKIASI